MASVNYKHVAILKNLIEAGFKEEKQIASLTINDAVKLPRCCRLDLVSVLECMQAVKSNKLLAYLIDENAKPGENENKEDADEIGENRSVE